MSRGSLNGLVVGSACYRVMESGSGIIIEEQVYLGKRHSWRYYRDPTTGRNWKENSASEFSPSRIAALRLYVATHMDSALWFYFRSVAKQRGRAENLLVEACALLWAECQKTGERPFNETSITAS